MRRAEYPNLLHESLKSNTASWWTWINVPEMFLVEHCFRSGMKALVTYNFVVCMPQIHLWWCSEPHPHRTAGTRRGLSSPRRRATMKPGTWLYQKRRNVLNQQTVWKNAQAHHDLHLDYLRPCSLSFCATCSITIINNLGRELRCSYQILCSAAVQHVQSSRTRLSAMLNDFED